MGFVLRTLKTCRIEYIVASKPLAGAALVPYNTSKLIKHTFKYDQGKGFKKVGFESNFVEKINCDCMEI